MKKIKQYPLESKEDFVIAFYLMAEHSGKYFLLLQQLLQDMEKELVIPIKKCLFSIMFYATDISVTLWIVGNHKKAKTIKRNDRKLPCVTARMKSCLLTPESLAMERQMKMAMFF